MSELSEKVELAIQVLKTFERKGVLMVMGAADGRN